MLFDSNNTTIIVYDNIDTNLSIIVKIYKIFRDNIAIFIDGSNYIILQKFNYELHHNTLKCREFEIQNVDACFIKTMIYLGYKVQGYKTSIFDYNNIHIYYEHKVQNEGVSQQAIKVLTRIKYFGFNGYLVGGCVRDLLLGIKPTDFDIVTDATPSEICDYIFANCKIVGKRFNLAHITFRKTNEIIEVATLRTNEGVTKDPTTGRITIDNSFSKSIYDDYIRRDFTINALYYNIFNYSVLDPTQLGFKDIQNKTIRIIGDPNTRFREDPVRMLRAIILANKIHFKIERKTAASIKKLSGLIVEADPTRIYALLEKIFFTGNAVANFKDLVKYGLFTHIFPYTDASDPLVLKFLEFIDETNHDSTSMRNFNALYSVLLYRGFLTDPEIFKKQSKHTTMPAYIERYAINMYNDENSSKFIIKKFI